MSLKLIYITNNPHVASIAEKSGVESIMIDLETLGKEERQKNMNTVKSHHDISDIVLLSHTLTKSEILVRVNPWNVASPKEIEDVIKAGATRIMLPMWKDMNEVDSFLKKIDRRVATTLLLETKEAASIIDDVLEHPLVDEIFIGLNDLHISYGLTFMFELLSNGVVEKICLKCREKAVPYGFGGIARLGEGMLPAEKIVMEHYRMGSSSAILSRSFCNSDEIKDLHQIEKIFSENMQLLRTYEMGLNLKREEEYLQNKEDVADCVRKVVERIKEHKTQ